MRLVQSRFSLNKNISFFAILTFCLFGFKLVAQDDGEAKKATMQIALSNQGDTLRQVKAIIKEEGESPLKDIEVLFYAKKSFGLLPLGDAVSTDENGEAMVDFPNDLPGDSLGNVTVIAKVEDNPKTGEMEMSKIVPWGVRTEADVMSKRALWASGANAPWPLVFVVTSTVLGVWGVIFYIIFLLFKIKKLGKYETT